MVDGETQHMSSV